MSTLVRPSMRNIPPSTLCKFIVHARFSCSVCSTLLVSPVRNHPSEVNSFAVASGFPQYSLCMAFTYFQTASLICWAFFSPEDIWPFDKELSLLAVKRRNLKMAPHYLYIDIMKHLVLRMLKLFTSELFPSASIVELPWSSHLQGKITNLGNASLIDLIACNSMQIRELLNTKTEKKTILRIQPDNPGLHPRQRLVHTNVVFWSQGPGNKHIMLCTNLTILACTPGKGLPTQPSTLSPSSGLDRAIPISVIPYLGWADYSNSYFMHDRQNCTKCDRPFQQSMAWNLSPPLQ